MAVGWAREGAVQEQIEATVEDAVQLARSRLPDAYQKEKVLSNVRNAKSKFRLPGGKQCRVYDYAFNVRKNWKKSRPRSVITIEVGIRTANLNDATIIDLFYKNV